MVTPVIPCVDCFGKHPHTDLSHGHFLFRKLIPFMSFDFDSWTFGLASSAFALNPIGGIIFGPENAKFETIAEGA